MNKQILETARLWSENNYFDPSFKKEIKQLIENNDQSELTDRFYQSLEFGTGGMRGLLGAGDNRMNIYTIRRATQGLANYIKAQKYKTPSVAIACDSRNFSDTFSREAARVLAANNIKVHLFPSLRPTPMLSYAVRELNCTAGIVITASHNPKEYNGYKVYWSDGCQIVSPHDRGIIACVNEITDFNSIKIIDYEQAINKNIIELIPDSLDDSYYKKLDSIALGDKQANEKLNLIFTALHGTGNIPVREILKRRGFKNLTSIQEQEAPDGNFSTVESPNPEEESTMKLAIKASKTEDQLILATDPDADRIGAMIRYQGNWKRLNGNQIGQLLLNYYLEKLKEQNKLPDNGYFITTIVTSELSLKIAKSFGLKTKECLTGFKYIGSFMKQLEEETGTFVFGNEESHGYLFCDFVRDKDAVGSAMLFAEMTAEYLSQGINPFDKLDQIHQNFGYHEDSLVNKVIKGQAGKLKIEEIMTFFRNTPPEEINGVKVNQIKDYQLQQVKNIKTGANTGKTTQPKANVIAFYMEDGSRITVRPSGTEPKIKFYFNLCGSDSNSLSDNRKRYEKDFLNIVDNI